MKNLAALFLTVFLTVTTASASYASTLTVTCGDNAYDALDTKDLSKAEFYAVLKLKGTTAPPQLLELSDDGNDLSEKVSSLNYSSNEGSANITISMKGADRYVIEGLKNCNDIDEAEGTIVYKKHVGGFAGYRNSPVEKCVCSKN